MSDFIFSNSNIKPNKLTKEIQSIYYEDKPLIKEFHGCWGSLGVSQNLYNGFDSYESEEFITIIIGGPILIFRDNTFLNHIGSSEGTKSIFERWKMGEMQWDNDLSGPFACLFINKITSEIICITDLMSFIPVYSYTSTNNIVLSTHVDALARITEQSNDFDEISIVDFILNGIVTHPYTTYTKLYQIDPATIHSLLKSKNKIKTSSYWLPKERNVYNTIDEAAKDLRDSLHIYIDKVTSETTNIAQFISGGEDSRLLSGLLKDYPRDAYIFLDYMNREGNIAKKVANVYGATLKLSTRSKLHYLDILPSSSRLVGSGSQYHHAHTYGFHKTCKLNTYNGVFGGLFSDALLKGTRIQKIKGSNKFPFIPDIKEGKRLVGAPIENVLFPKSILVAIAQRQKEHLEKVKEIRKESAEEWFKLWPISMNPNIPNIHTNRRLFRSYEPFTSNKVVKISASVPQQWKLNRKLFNKAAKPLLKPSKWLFHGDGWLPYFPWYYNIFIRFSTWTYRQIAKRLGLIKGNQGPWNEWNKLVKSPEWKKTIQYSKGFNKIPNTYNGISLSQILDDRILTTHQYINLTQTLHEIDNRYS